MNNKTKPLFSKAKLLFRTPRGGSIYGITSFVYYTLGYLPVFGIENFLTVFYTILIMSELLDLPV